LSKQEDLEDILVNVGDDQVDVLFDEVFEKLSV